MDHVMGNRAPMKLTPAEIARQALDRSHLEPDPVLCLADRWVCTRCGLDCRYDLGHLEDADVWLASHRKGACSTNRRGAGATIGGKDDDQGVGDGRRVLGPVAGQGGEG
jgi:hypothetical protein